MVVDKGRKGFLFRNCVWVDDKLFLGVVETCGLRLFLRYLLSEFVGWQLFEFEFGCVLNILQAQSNLSTCVERVQLV